MCCVIGYNLMFSTNLNQKDKVEERSSVLFQK
jgi:hypothetical protein